MLSFARKVMLCRNVGGRDPVRRIPSRTMWITCQLEQAIPGHRLRLLMHGGPVQRECKSEVEFMLSLSCIRASRSSGKYSSTLIDDEVDETTNIHPVMNMVKTRFIVMMVLSKQWHCHCFSANKNFTAIYTKYFFVTRLTSIILLVNSMYFFIAACQDGHWSYGFVFHLSPFSFLSLFFCFSTDLICTCFCFIRSIFIVNNLKRKISLLDGPRLLLSVSLRSCLDMSMCLHASSFLVELLRGRLRFLFLLLSFLSSFIYIYIRVV